jgi:hypothetical protein
VWDVCGYEQLIGFLENHALAHADGAGDDGD